MKNVQKGFTLIELMIVVAIIAILAAIAIPQYQNYIIRTQVSEGMNLADGAKTAVAEFYNNKGKFPGSNGSAGVAPEASISGKYVESVLIDTNGAITAKFGKESNTKLAGKFLTLSPYDATGSIVWNCRATSGATQKTDIDEAYLPTSCRK